MSALERRSGAGLVWRRVTVSLALAAVALTCLLSAPPSVAQETPTAASALSFDVTCTPDTFRPDEYVAVECINRFANQGQDTLTGLSVEISTLTTGVVPTYFFMWFRHNGEFAPIGTGALTFEHPDLGPGETVVSSIVVLLNMAEGAFETELRASVRGQVVQTVPIRFVATPGAAEPPTDLLVTTELVGEVNEEPQPTATYQTTITNQSSAEATALTLTERHHEAVTIASAEPAPISQNAAVQIASWDLLSFGKDSLAPGESLVLRMTYGPAEGVDCGWASSGFVVEATVDGQEQRYGARPIAEQLVGECAYPQIGGGGELPTTLGRGGEGPVPPGGGASWAAAALAGIGLLLIAAGLAARRRVLSR